MFSQKIPWHCEILFLTSLSAPPPEAILSLDGGRKKHKKHKKKSKKHKKSSKSDSELEDGEKRDRKRKSSLGEEDNDRKRKKVKKEKRSKSKDTSPRIKREKEDKLTVKKEEIENYQNQHKNGDITDKPVEVARSEVNLFIYMVW